MKMIDELISKNKMWSEGVQRQDPHFFQNLSKGQSPSIFWIGCCDSRVIPTEIFNMSLGDFFIHTNIANQFHGDDINAMGALEYAVNNLGVSHVIVCGHTQCGGIQQALLGSKDLSEPLQKWIAPIEELKFFLGKDSEENSDGSSGKNSRQNFGESSDENSGESPIVLSEMNIKRQVEVISQCKLIKALWEKEKGPEIHGWLFQVETGLIKKICRAFPLEGE